MRDREAEQLRYQIDRVQHQLQIINNELTRMMGGMNCVAFGVLNCIPELLEMSNYKPLTVAEIGVYRADTTVQMLRHLNIEKYYAIDPWEYDSQNSEISAVKKDVSDREVYDYVKDRLRGYNNVQIIKKTSADALDEIEDNSLDFCFIDGDHDADAVYEDFVGYYEKVKVGGIMSGDDWHWESVRAGIFAALGLNAKDFKAPIEQNAVVRSKEIQLAYDFRDTFRLWYFLKG